MLHGVYYTENTLLKVDETCKATWPISGTGLKTVTLGMAKA